MALHVLPGQRSFGQDIGSTIGSGLGQGINSLLQQKLQSINSDKFSKSLQSIGIDPQISSFVSQQSPQFQQQFLSQLDFGDMGLGSQAASGSMPSVQSPVRASIRPSKEKEKMMHEDQKLINKQVLPYFKEIQDKGKSAKENDLRLKRMEKLIDTGKLNNPQFSSLLKTLKHGVWGVGLDLTSLLSPESQEFDKLSGDFVKNAKEVFGNRITDTDLKSFLATIPNLSQTNEGKAAVIRNLKLMNQAADIREKAARQLVKKYGTKLPVDFESQVEEMIQPQLDKIAVEFESGSSNPVNPTTTLVGDLLRTPGRLL